MGTSDLTGLICFLLSHSGWARNLHEGNNFIVAEWEEENVILTYRIYTDLNISTLCVQDHVLNVHIRTVRSKVRSLCPIYQSVFVPLTQTVAIKSLEYGKLACLLS
jgi:hypothetical protein